MAVEAATKVAGASQEAELVAAAKARETKVQLRQAVDAEARARDRDTEELAAPVFLLRHEAITQQAFIDHHSLGPHDRRVVFTCHHTDRRSRRNQASNPFINFDSWHILGKPAKAK